jgi:hypothetical protein
MTFANFSHSLRRSLSAATVGRKAPGRGGRAVDCAGLEIQATDFVAVMLNRLREKILKLVSSGDRYAIFWLLLLSMISCGEALTSIFDDFCTEREKSSFALSKMFGDILACNCIGVFWQF